MHELPKDSHQLNQDQKSIQQWPLSETKLVRSVRIIFRGNNGGQDLRMRQICLYC